MTATNLVLTPNGKELKQWELQLTAKEISGFEFARVKDGDSTHGELRFQIVTSQEGAAALIEQYIRNIGKSEAQLRVGYEQQVEMDLGDEKPEDEDRLIFEEQAHDTSEATDEPEDAPLASAVLMGGTHQKAKREPRKSGGKVN